MILKTNTAIRPQSHMREESVCDSPSVEMVDVDVTCFYHKPKMALLKKFFHLQSQMHLKAKAIVVMDKHPLAYPNYLKIDMIRPLFSKYLNPKN